MTKFVLVDIPWRLSSSKRFTYYSLVSISCLYFYFWRVKNSAMKLELNLDNAFTQNQEILANFPSYPREFQNRSNDPETCSLLNQTVSWHWALDDLFRPFHWFDTDCSDPKYYSSHDFSNYLDIIRKSGKNTTKIEFENIDNLRYPQTWPRIKLKVINYIQEQVLANVRAVTDKELESSPNDISVDFKDPKNPKMTITVKDRRIQHPQIEPRIKDLDSNHLNILNIFVDTVSRGRFYRKYPKLAKFLVETKYDSKKANRVFEFTKMNSLYGHTFPNLLASEYGLEFDPWRGRNRTRIEHFAFDQGYVTGVSQDLCQVQEQDVEVYDQMFDESYDDTWIQHHATV